MLPAPKIVKAESNHTDLHAKIAEPPPIFYKDSEKIPLPNEASSFYVQKVLVGGVFRMRGAEGGCGSFRHRCFSGKSPLSDGLEDRAGKNAFSSVLRVVLSSPAFSYFCIFSLLLVCKVFRTNPFFVFTGEAFPDLSCILLAQL